MATEQNPNSCALCDNPIDHPDGPSLDTINGQACLHCAHNLHIYTFALFLVVDTHRFTVSVAPVFSDHVSIGEHLVAIDHESPETLTDHERGLVETLARWETPDEWAEVDITEFDRDKYERVTPELFHSSFGKSDLDRALASQLPRPAIFDTAQARVPPDNEDQLRDTLEPSPASGTNSTQGALTEF